MFSVQTSKLFGRPSYTKHNDTIGNTGEETIYWRCDNRECSGKIKRNQWKNCTFVIFSNG